MWKCDGKKVGLGEEERDLINDENRRDGASVALIKATL
jgi:hypothetical protein